MRVGAGKARCGVDRFCVPVFGVERVGGRVEAGKTRCGVDRFCVPVFGVERVGVFVRGLKGALWG